MSVASEKARAFNGQNCASCEHSGALRRRPDKLVCRLKPPVVVLAHHHRRRSPYGDGRSYSHESMFPVVHPDWRCGEWVEEDLEEEQPF